MLGGEYIAFTGLAYTDDDLILYFYSTNEGNTNTYGKSTTKTKLSPIVEYSPQEVTFFGFKSRISTTGQLSGLSLIGYVTSCVNKFKQQLGDDFVWFTPEVVEEDPDKQVTDGEKDGGGKVTTSDGEVAQEDDSGMSPGGVVALILFLMVVVALAVVGVMMYRKDKLCLRKNLDRCKNSKLCVKCRQSKLCEKLSQKCTNCRKRREADLNDSGVSSLMGEKHQIHPGGNSSNFVQSKVVEVVNRQPESEEDEDEESESEEYYDEEEEKPEKSTNMSGATQQQQ